MEAGGGSRGGISGIRHHGGTHDTLRVPNTHRHASHPAHPRTSHATNTQLHQHACQDHHRHHRLYTWPHSRTSTIRSACAPTQNPRQPHATHTHRALYPRERARTTRRRRSRLLLPLLRRTTPARGRPAAAASIAAQATKATTRAHPATVPAATAARCLRARVIGVHDGAIGKNALPHGSRSSGVARVALSRGCDGASAATALPGALSLGIVMLY